MRSESLQSHRASVILYPVYTDRLGHSQNKNPIFLYPVYTDRGENPIYLHPVYTDSLGNSQKQKIQSLFKHGYAGALSSGLSDAP